MNRRITIILILLLSIPSSIFAETIILQSGRKMDGKIMEKTDKEIKVNTGSILTSYRIDEVESIDGVRTELFKSAVNGSQDLNKPAEQKDVNALKEAITRGSDYLDKKRYEMAIAEFSKAIEINPGLSDVYYNRGFAYSQSGKPDEAISDYSKAIKINPNDSDSYYNRGLVYHSKKDYDRAISDFTESIRLTPDIAAAYYNRALDYSLKKDFDKAWEDVHKAQSLGYEVSAFFLTELKKASKREE